jgi:hypothetical protein
MTRTFRSLLFCWSVLLLAAVSAHAQWHTQSYVLHRGWNALWMPVDLTDVEIDDLNLPLEIEEIWRWEPNDDAATFVEDVNESITLERVEDWRRWKRGDAIETDLLWLRGNATYLFKVNIPTGTTLAWSITGRATAPEYKWRTDGLNFYGFNVRSGFNTTFNQYLQGAGLVDFNTQIFRYPGNDLNAVQPQILNNPRQAVLAPMRGYWIRSDRYSTFAGPVSVIPGGGDGLFFDNLSGRQSLQLRNASALADPVSITLEVVPSEAYPAYASAPTSLRSGLVKLALRSFDPDTGAQVLSPLTGDSLTLELAQNAIRDLVFVVDWANMSANPGERFESLLRITDSRNLVEYFLPVVAEAPVRTGLWMGEATITHVRNQFYDPEAEGQQENGMFPVRRPATLRLLVHYDANGTARLLSQAYLGVNGEDEIIVSTAEAPLDASRLDSAIRLTAAHLPPAHAFVGTATGDELAFSVQVPFDDPHNPFVHAYHPDHDNIANDGSALAPNIESFTIDRVIQLIFSDEPLPGLSVDWGGNVIGGTFAEAISGLHRYGLEAEGTFFLQRISDAATFELP